MATESPEKKNYKTTLNLPQTAFAMEAKLVQNEPKRLAMWQEGRLYEKMLTDRASHGKGKWILHDGPPFANGDIHIGHLINKTLKDVILRFRTMEGYETPYVPGWDCHGLPIEHKIQEEVKKAGGDFRAMSTLEVRQLCYASAHKFAVAQAEQFQRLGILGEWSNPYLTMKPEYEAETLEVFARFVEAGLVYKQLKPVPWSVASQTALADAELEYKDVEDASVYVEFPVAANGQQGQPFDKPAYFLVWTTTPWTLPANLAIAVNADVQYSLVEYTRAGERRIGIVAADLREKVFALCPEAESVKVLNAVMSGAELSEQLRYIHPFTDYTGSIVTAEYVTTTDGTGLVHTAPGHGEDDYDTGTRHGLKVYSPVLASGRFDDTVPEFIRGKTTKEGNGLIADELQARGRLFAKQTILHSYPHDWRTKTPIIFRATEQWFIAIEKPFLAKGETGKPRSLRDRASAACESGIDFIPAWGQARLQGMLQSRPDWCISRQRAWGLPIPVFYNQKGESLLTPESVRAVAKRFREKGSDAWFTETPTELLSCDQTACPIHFSETADLRKEKDIFDVWFESGSSWHAVLQARTYLHFPADLYLEGSDQHRGWFQLSLLPSLGATGKAPFKQVLTHGFIVKPDGTKVSKSDKEYVKAVDEINRHGADVLRLWCCSVDYQNDIPASPKAIQEFGDKYRKIRNTLRYLLSNLYDFNARTDALPVPQNSLDGWAMHQLDLLITEVTGAYDAYQLHRVFRLLHDFCSVQLSSIYGNAMKDRLYCEAPAGLLRRRCQTVMHKIAVALTKLLAPMLVFTADEVWEHIPHKSGTDASLQSVHLALLPQVSGNEVTADQLAEWKLLMELRDQGLGQLDHLKKDVALNKAGDAEIIYQVDDDATRRKLQAYGVDLEDLVGCGHYAFAEKGTAGPAVTVKIVDRRNDYAACARSWKRRPDVGTDAEYPDVSLRDAAALRSIA
jgi:isoleucyl-tRNA synthetase